MITIRLKEVAKQKGYTLTDISRATRISMNTLSVLGRGDSNGIQFDTLEKICSFLDVTPNDIIELSSDKYIVVMPVQRRINNQAIAYVYNEKDYKKMSSNEGPMLKIDNNNEHLIVVTQMNESKDMVQFFMGFPVQRTDATKKQPLLTEEELSSTRDWLRSLGNNQKKSICEQAAYLYMKQFLKGNYPDSIFTAVIAGEISDDKSAGIIYPFWVGSKTGKLVDLHFRSGGPIRPDDLD